MIPELGHVALVVALVLSGAQALFALAGAAVGNHVWMSVGRTTARGQAAFLSIALAALAYSFIINDFSVAYVAQNSNSALPLHYRISAVWGAHEGSMLLWGWILSLWTLAVTVFSRGLPAQLLARVLGVMGLVSLGFLAFILTTSNPFSRLDPAMTEGRDLNPLLQDPGLIFHPPLLYLGYVGFAVGFAFAIAALLGGRLDAAWARWSRPWTLAAWSFLTLGIALGSFWAYYELGWGGWWFWDPVENASFMPWLAATALIHSSAVTEKRGVLKGWTVLLAITVFALSLLGTFLVRSGVLTSVHAFATDPSRGVFILGLLVVVIGGSLLLYAWRAATVSRASASFVPISREGFILVNNLLLFVAMATVLLGTLYPLAVDALGYGKLSVGPPYFNTVFIPLMLTVALVMGAGVIARWKNDSAARIGRRLRMAAVATAVVAVVVIAVTRDATGIRAALAVSLALWIVSSTITAMNVRFRPLSALAASLAQVPAAQWGMVIAHIGFAVALVGIALSSLYSTETHQRMVPGDRVEVAGYAFAFMELREVDGPNYRATEAVFEVAAHGQPATVLRAQKRIYSASNMPMTEAGIDGAFTRDLYVSLGEPLEGNAWSMRLYVKPFIRWIWLGAILIAAGGFVAAFDRRYRLLARRNIATGPATERRAMAGQ